MFFMDGTNKKWNCRGKRIRDFPVNTTQTESNENRNYHPYLGKRNNNIIYFYEVTTTGMFNFTKTPMESEQTGQYLWHSNWADVIPIMHHSQPKKSFVKQNDRSKKYSFFILISVFNT
jgi:hypothetical protein